MLLPYSVSVHLRRDSCALRERWTDTRLIYECFYYFPNAFRHRLRCENGHGRRYTFPLAPTHEH